MSRSDLEIAFKGRAHLIILAIIVLQIENQDHNCEVALIPLDINVS